ncbi:MAG: DNA-directed RNA polymerase subunit alpha [Clostridiales bacterium]|jgi:DNA-directed RNA polymerase subunit alpha|nr:DNA-directed RNA polymerase subunit alpha [Clostridiales bacterium]
MLEIERPRITPEENEDGSHVHIVVEPLERGFGITLGNCLRRVLLSALPGAAITGIRIEGVKHEFSTIKGVREDVAEIILNLKDVAVKAHPQERAFRTTVKLNRSAPGAVTAGDIETNSEVEILNPDRYICSLDAGAHLEMELTIGRGRGYTGASGNKDANAPLGFIPIDSIFTPVKKVNFEVGNTRVGQSIDFDKLTLDVVTNGTMSAKEVVSLAAKVVEDHIRLFVDLSESVASGGSIVKDPTPGTTRPVMEMNIEELELSVRSFNCLKRANINTVEQLTRRSEEDMLKVRNLGRKSLDEVIEKLRRLGVDLLPLEE